MNRAAWTAWWGAPKDGSGVVRTGTGALKEAGFECRSRFENGPGTGPEASIGAAHAARCSMALSMILEEAGLIAERMESRAAVTLKQLATGRELTDVHLDVSARVPGVEHAMFQGLAHKARNACTVSSLLKAHLTVDASLLA